MNPKTNRLYELYKQLDRKLIDKSIYDLVISEQKKDIEYSPPYQRNYTWSNIKGINLIETVLIHGIIPPLTVIEHNGTLEIVDRKTAL